MNVIEYLIEKIKNVFKPKMTLAPPMPKNQQRKKPAAKKTTAKKVSKK